MKRNFTIIFILSCFLFTSIILSQQCKKDEFMPTVKNGAVISSSQSVLASNLTSILHQIWIPNSWEDANRIVYTYNASGLLEKVSYDSLSNGSWKTFGSMTMAYNSSDQLIEEISSYYESDGTLVHGVKWTHSYSGNIMSEGIQYMWDVDNELWESYKKQIYTYTGDLITKIEDYSDMGDGSWELADENTFTYDGQSREIESLTRTWSVIDNQFTNSDLTTTEYYKEHKMSKWHSRSWDLLNEQWSEENFTLVEYDYDGSDNCIEEVSTASFGIAGFSFATKSKLTFSYDGNNLLIETIDYTWDDGSSQFLPIIKSEITNNNEGLPEVMLHYVHAGGEWVKAEKDIYNYDGAVAVDDIELLPTEFVLKQNYPNPFNPSTTISYDVSKTDNVKIIIYDILGNYVNTLVDEMKSPGQYSKSFDASKLASGTYIYTLKSGNIILSKKCLLIK